MDGRPTRREVVWDNHACMPLRPGDVAFLPQLRRVRAAGVDVITLNAGFGRQTPEAALSVLAAFRCWLGEHADEFLLVHDVEDIEAARRSGRLGVCFDIEGMDVLGGRLENVRRFHELGVRWMLGAYNASGMGGGGCLEPDDGLTPFGRQVIEEMNAVGMTVCASHCGYRTAREMIDRSADPVIFSHSNPRALCDHPRNIPDDLMIACAARGGVVGICGFGPLLGPSDDLIDTYVTHLEYALDVIGEDAVGVALDYVFDRQELDDFIASDPTTFPPALYGQGAKMIAPWRLPAVAERLDRRGHSTAAIAKLLGGNHLRIAKEIWPTRTFGGGSMS